MYFLNMMTMTQTHKHAHLNMKYTNTHIQTHTHTHTHTHLRVSSRFVSGVKFVMKEGNCDIFMKRKILVINEMKRDKILFKLKV